MPGAAPRRDSAGADVDAGRRPPRLAPQACRKARGRGWPPRGRPRGGSAPRRGGARSCQRRTGPSAQRGAPTGTRTGFADAKHAGQRRERLDRLPALSRAPASVQCEGSTWRPLSAAVTPPCVCSVDRHEIVDGVDRVPDLGRAEQAKPARRPGHTPRSSRAGLLAAYGGRAPRTVRLRSPPRSRLPAPRRACTAATKRSRSTGARALPPTIQGSSRRGRARPATTSATRR